MSESFAITQDKKIEIYDSMMAGRKTYCIVYTNHANGDETVIAFDQAEFKELIAKGIIAMDSR